VRAVDLIVKKRNGGKLTAAEISFIIDEYTAGRIPDYQLSAFTMAVFFRGMDFEETACLTEAMLSSGEQLDFSAIKRQKIDKHSTGGVGDKISLILAPIVAACGVSVPMLCGRGLGHTGGTIDKLESIEGYQTARSEESAREVLEQVGFVFMSQTDTIVPADKKLYALRDVTGAVESIPLITASILSKKLAEGADGFVFDVKAGLGAFMKNSDDAKALALSLTRTAHVLGKKARAVITAMDEPLGYTIGNLIEVGESVECLLGKIPPDIGEITFRLGAHMLLLAGVVKTVHEGVALCARRIEDRSAYALFLKNIEAQGGNPDAVADPEKIPEAARKTAVRAAASGFVTKVDAYKIGIASMLLGAGRAKKESPIQPRAGIRLIKKCGDTVKKNDELCLLYTEEGARTDEAYSLAQDAFAIGAEPPAPQSRILLELGDT
jgi:pyrimidine-nucleoside phosphorylase